MTEIVKRIADICGEFDCRVEAVGLPFARTEIAKVLAEKESALAAKETELADLREMHRIAWTNEAALTKELEDLHKKYEIFDPVCRECGDPLITEELICDECRKCPTT